MHVKLHEALGLRSRASTGAWWALFLIIPGGYFWLLSLFQRDFTYNKLNINYNIYITNETNFCLAPRFK